MRSILYITLLLSLIMASCNKYDIQPEQAEGFIKFYASNKTERGVDVKQTPDGGYVAVGNSMDMENESGDIYLIKTDQYGNEESWSPVIIGGDYDDVATSLLVVSDGYVILGYSKMEADSSYDMYIVKVDLQGNQVWENWFGGTADDKGSNLLLSPDGGFIAAGETSSFGPGLPGTQFNAWLVVFDDSGNKISHSAQGFTGENFLTSYLTEGENFYLLCGVNTAINSRIRLYPIDKSRPSLVLDYPSTSTTGVSSNCMRALNGGDFLICGTVQAPSGFTKIYMTRVRPASTNWQTTFSVVWEKSYPEENQQVSYAGNDVKVIDDNTYAVIGTRTTTGNDDIVLVLFDANGVQTRIRSYGDAGFQLGEGLDLTSDDNGLIIVGTNGSEDNSMISLLKTDAAGEL